MLRPPLGRTALAGQWRATDVCLRRVMWLASGKGMRKLVAAICFLASCRLDFSSPLAYLRTLSRRANWRPLAIPLRLRAAW